METDSFDCQKPFHTPTLLRLSRICIHGCDRSRQQWKVLEVWQREQSCKWSRTLAEAARKKNQNGDTQKHLGDGGWNLANSLECCIEQYSFQAVAVVLEHYETALRFAVVFQRADPRDLPDWELDYVLDEVSTRLYLTPFLLPVQESGCDIPQLLDDAKVVRFEAAMKSELGSKLRKDAPTATRQKVLLCYTIELSIDWHTEGHLATFQRPYHETAVEDEQVEPLFEKAFQNHDEAWCMAPWSTGSSILNALRERGIQGQGRLRGQYLSISRDDRCARDSDSISITSSRRAPPIIVDRVIYRGRPQLRIPCPTWPA